MSRANTLRFEAWTLPWSGDFHRVIASMPVIEGSANGSIMFNAAAGDGSLDIDAATFKRLGSVIDSNSGTLIRVYDGTNIIHEWLAERLSQSHENDQIVTISGPSLQASLDKWVVYPYDYPDQPTLDPDWNWGNSENNILDNPGFENPALPNGDFEDGSTNHWNKTDKDGFINPCGEFHVVQNTGEAQDGDWYGIVTPDGTNSGIQRSVSELKAGEVYTLTGFANEDTASGQRIRLGVSGASIATSTNAYTANGVFWWVELDNAPSGSGSADGTWQEFELTFMAASSTIDIVVLYTGGGTGLPFRVDSFKLEGWGIGLAPWQPQNASPGPGFINNDVFEIEDNSPILEGLQSCEFRGRAIPNPLYEKFDFPGITQDISLSVGKTYTLEGYAYHSSAEDEKLAVSLRRRSQIQDFPGYSDSVMFRASETVPPNTWTLVRATGVSEVVNARYRFNWVYQGEYNPLTGPLGEHQSPLIHFDKTALYEGFPPATAGKILKTLLDDATIDHANDPRGTVMNWILYGSWGVNLDANDVEWDEEISYSVPFGSTYGQVLDGLAELGYEWELVPMVDPDPAGPTHRLHLYNPDGRDDEPATAINVRQGVTGGEVVYRQPNYTATIIEGSSGSYHEQVSGTANNFGRTEHYEPARHTAGDTLDKLAGIVLRQEKNNRTAVRFEVVATDDHPHPIVDYLPGDTLYMQLPPVMQRESRRVERIDYVNSTPTAYVVVGSQILTGEAGGWELVRRLWRRFMRRQRQSKGGVPAEGSGGQPTIVLAASNASPDSVRKADIQATGTADETSYLEAVARCITTDGETKGLIQLTEGTFNTTQTLYVPYGIILQGMGRGTTIEADTGADIWAVEVESGGVGVARDMVVNNASGSGARIVGTPPG